MGEEMEEKKGDEKRMEKASSQLLFRKVLGERERLVRI